FNLGRSVIMKRRDDFFLDGLPKLNRMIIKYFNDPTTEEIALERGAIDFYSTANPVMLARAGKHDNVMVAKKGYEALGALVWLEFNTKSKYLKHVKVRQALAYATTVEFMIEQLQGGFSKRSPSPIAMGSPFFKLDVPTYEYNPAKAKKLLNQAGFPAGPDGKRFALH